jgi:hypothetical protein
MSDTPPPTDAPEAPLPPRFWFVFDWRLLASLLAVGVIAFVSCDVVNAKVDAKIDRWLERARPVPQPTEWKTGAIAEVELTLVTKDADRLGCADDREFDGARCEYSKEKRRLAVDPASPLDDNRIRTIQPYRTAVGNYLIMVAGLWATPALAMRRHFEPSRGVAEKELRRFIARCRLRFLGGMDNVELRWDVNQKWYVEKYGHVARAESCVVIGPDE